MDPPVKRGKLTLDLEKAREERQTEEYIYWGQVFDLLVGEWTRLVSQVAVDDKKWPPKRTSAYPKKGDMWQKEIWLNFTADWTAPPNGDIVIDGPSVKMGHKKFAELYCFWYSFSNDLMRKVWKSLEKGDYIEYEWYTHDKGSAILIRLELNTAVIDNGK